MFYDYGFIEWNNSQIEDNIASIKEAERLLNERGYLFANEDLGLPIPTEEPWITDGVYIVSAVCDDGTVLLNFEPCTKSRFDYLVEDINEKFKKLERRINNA